MFRRVDRNEPAIGDDCTFSHGGRCGGQLKISNGATREARLPVIQIKLAQSSIPRQLPPTPMRVFPVRVELPFDMTIERPHHSYSGEPLRR